ncbi:MAG: glycosyltransferase [candidate division Zixibacteria bacterium]|nr:glycosyltransferase [candidate division Zixibacteria bacterium]
MSRYQRKQRIDVSVIVPAHNEEDNVQPLLEQFAELAQRSRFSLEVIMVDDGSTDRTLPRLVEMQKRHRFIHIVSVPTRRGLTEGLEAGFSVANGGILVFYPADRQFHPNDIPKMVEKVREGYDLVTGRKIGQYNKRVVSGVYNKISRILFPSIQVTDLNSVKAFRRELVNVFDYRHDWHRFWVAIVAEAGFRIGEVDVTLYQRTQGKSKFGIWRIPGAVLDLLAVKFQYHTMRRPLWYFGFIGSVLLLAAFVIGVWALYERYVLGEGHRPLVYLVMTLGIAGIVFFTLGFLAESVAGIRERVELVRGLPRRSFYQPPSRGSSHSSDDRGSDTQSQQSRSDSRSSRGRSRGGDRDRGGRRGREDRRGGRSRDRSRDPGESDSKRAPSQAPEKDSSDKQSSPRSSRDSQPKPEERKRDNSPSRPVVEKTPETTSAPPDKPRPAETSDDDSRPKEASFGRRNRR